MNRILVTATFLVTLGGTAMAQSDDTGATVTQATGPSVTIGVIEGDGLENARTTTTTVTTGSGDSATSSETDTADFRRYFDDAGNPTYMPDVSFSLD